MDTQLYSLLLRTNLKAYALLERFFQRGAYWSQACEDKARLLFANKVADNIDMEIVLGEELKHVW